MKDRVLSPLKRSGSRTVRNAGRISIRNAAGEWGLLVDQARGGASRAAGENSRAKNYGKNDRCNIHGIFLLSSEVKQMKNKGKRWANFLLTIGNRPVAIRRKTLFPFLPVSWAV